LRLANLPNFALDHLSRYEATLWRQAGRMLYALEKLDRRKPQERASRFSGGGQLSVPAVSLPDKPLMSAFRKKQTFD